MEFFLGLFWNPKFPFLTFFTPVFAFAYWWLGELWDRDERHVVAFWLQQNRPAARYRDLITRALDGISRIVGRHEVRARERHQLDWPEPETLERNRQPWSWGLLDLTLLAAIAYPILSVLGQWAAGGAGRLGTLSILPQTATEDRWFPTLLMLGSLSLYGVAIGTKLRSLRALVIPAIGCWLWATVVELSAGAFALALVYALTASGMVSFTGAGTVAFAGAFAVASLTFFADVGTGAASYVVAFIFFLVFAGIVAGDRVRSKIERQMTRSSLVLLAWTALWYIVLVASVLGYTSDSAGHEVVATIVLFIGFLPLLNAVADFVSWGLTRHFLSRGEAGRPGYYGAIDLALGGLSFIGLGCAVILTVALVRGLGGPVLIDLSVLLAPATMPNSILAQPHDYWWLYVTFMSTLLPTLAHGMIALFAVFVMWPAPLRTWLARNLNTGGYLWGRLACLVLSVLIALAVAVPLAALYHLSRWLAVDHPEVGAGLIAGFRWFAGAVGVL